MDAAEMIELLRSLGPLATQFGWPAVFVFVCLPKLFAFVDAHIALMKAMREELPKIRRNQRIGIRVSRKQVSATEGQSAATAALARVLQEARPTSASGAI